MKFQSFWRRECRRYDDHTLPIAFFLIYLKILILISTVFFAVFLAALAPGQSADPGTD
jgi:hypothetical protein